MRVAWCFLLVLLSANVTFACSCDSIPDHDAAFESAEMVFRGTLVDVNTNWMSSGYKLTFQVGESWKKSLEWFATINTKNLEECDFRFEVDQEYLVYTHKKFSRKTTPCFGTVHISVATDRLTSMGPGQAPGPSDNLPRVMIGMSVAIFLGLAFVAFVVLKNKINPSKS